MGKEEDLIEKTIKKCLILWQERNYNAVVDLLIATADMIDDYAPLRHKGGI